MGQSTKSVGALSQNGYGGNPFTNAQEIGNTDWGEICGYSVYTFILNMDIDLAMTHFMYLIWALIWRPFYIPKMSSSLAMTDLIYLIQALLYP